MNPKRLLAPLLSLALLLCIAVPAGFAPDVPNVGTTRRLAIADEVITTVARGALRGKKIACLGDSITYGSGGQDKPDGTKVAYCDYLAEYSGAEVLNLGIGGSPLSTIPGEGSNPATSMVNRYKTIPQDSDIVVLLAGVNDYLIGVDHFGTPGENIPGTYCGDAMTLFAGLRAQCPTAEIWVVIPPDDWQLHVDALEARNFPFDRFLAVQRDLAVQYDYKVIDLYREGFMDNKDHEIADTIFADSIHPNDAGYRLLARHIMARLVVGR